MTNLQEAISGLAQVTLVGPQGLGGDSSKWVRELVRGGIEVLPEQNTRRLTELVASSDVGLVPYRVTRYTSGISPLKTYEYLAAGLPVVSTNLDPTAAIEGAVWVEPNQASYIARVRNLLERDTSEARASRRIIAKRHGWAARGSDLRSLLRELVRRPPAQRSWIDYG